MKQILTTIFLSLVLFSCLTDGEAGRVSLTGEGTVSAAPDRASFTLTFRETAPTTREAGQAVNALTDRALTVLSSHDIPGENIRTTGINFYRKTRWNEGEEILLGQEAVQTLNITVDLDDKASNLNEIIDELTGIDDLGMGNLQMTLSAQSPYRQEAREAAYADALNRARHYAELAGRKLGPLLELRESGASGSFEGSLKYAMAPQAESSLQVQTGSYDITVVIEAVFALE